MFIITVNVPKYNNKNREIEERFMKNQQVAITRSELREFAETLAIVQQLPQVERIAMQYYIKGVLEGLNMSGEVLLSTVGGDNQPTAS